MTKEVPWEYDIDITAYKCDVRVVDLPHLNREIKDLLKGVRVQGSWTITEINHQPDAGEEFEGVCHVTAWADIDVKESEVWAVVMKATKALKKGKWEIEKIVIYPQHPS